MLAKAPTHELPNKALPHRVRILVRKTSCILRQQSWKAAAAVAIRTIPFSSASRSTGVTFQQNDADPLARPVSNIAQTCSGSQIIIFPCGSRSDRGASAIAVILISVPRLLAPKARRARCAHVGRLFNSEKLFEWIVRASLSRQKDMSGVIHS